MVHMLKTLDQIAREKERDVLYLTFHHGAEEDVIDKAFDWEASPMRKKVINMLETSGIPYQACFPAQPTNGTVMLVMPYAGQIYIDIQHDKSSDLYKKLEFQLENPDGSMKLPDVIFWCYPLELAMLNAEQDEPGYWDNF